MEYKGKLYGKVAGGYFPTGKTSEDWDKLEAENKLLAELFSGASNSLSKKNEQLNIVATQRANKINKKDAEILLLNNQIKELKEGIQFILDDCPDADPADGGQTLVVNKIRLEKLLEK